MTDEDWADYDSGPFCRHWSDPSYCDKLCAGCQHSCLKHYWSSCNVEDCECEEWQEPTEN